MKPLRILIAGQSYADGNGQGCFTLRLAENLVKQGHQVKMLTPCDSLKSFCVNLNGVQVEKVAAIHMSILHPAIYVTPLPSPRVKSIFDDFVPDIVHIQDHYFLCQAVAQEARRRDVPLIGTNHFLPENLLPFLIKFPRVSDRAGRILWKMMLSVFNQVDAATTPSAIAAEILRHQDIRFPVYVVSNGVDTERFTPNSKVDRQSIRRAYGLALDKPIFLYVGRLDGEKRVDILLQAVSYLPYSNFQLVIVGCGLQAPALRRQMYRLGLEERVLFLGYVPATDLPSLYASADIFAMPGAAELQSIATMEALACGKPVLAANARALPELVVHGVNGYLFEPGNAIDAAYWMNKFLERPDQWAAMGQSAVARSQAHTLINTIKSYEDYYRMMIEKHREIYKSFAPAGTNTFESHRSKKLTANSTKDAVLDN